MEPSTRAELWQKHKDGLIEAGILSVQVKQLAPDEGAGRHDSELPTMQDWLNRTKLSAVMAGGE